MKNIFILELFRDKEKYISKFANEINEIKEYLNSNDCTEEEIAYLEKVLNRKYNTLKLIL